MMEPGTRQYPGHIVRSGSSHVSAIALITASLSLVISVLAFLDIGSTTSPLADEHAQQPPEEKQNQNAPASANGQADKSQSPGDSAKAQDQTEKGPQAQDQNQQNATQEQRPQPPANQAGNASSGAIPQPGEQLDKPRPAKRITPGKKPLSGKSESHAANQASDQEVISWKQAAEHMGRRETVQGKIVDTHMIESGQICFLNFSKQWQGKFYLAMFKEAFANLPDPPQDYYLNKTVRVNGLIKTHEGRPQIEIHDPDQITLVRR